MKNKKILIILGVIIILVIIGLIFLIRYMNMDLDDILKSYDYKIETVRDVGDTYTMGEGFPELVSEYKEVVYYKDAIKIIVTYRNNNDEVVNSMKNYRTYYSDLIDNINYIEKRNYYYLNGYLKDSEQYVYVLGYDNIEIHCLSYDHVEKEFNKMFKKIIGQI